MDNYIDEYMIWYNMVIKICWNVSFIDVNGTCEATCAQEVVELTGDEDFRVLKGRGRRSSLRGII